MASPEFIFIDLFCGAGGTSTGLLKARYRGARVVKLAGCINHDPFAILSHAFNHKGVKHFTEDIRTFNVNKFRRLIAQYRKRYPLAKICLWGSLECIEYSRAKGGKSRNADSRTLAVELFRYINAINPDYIFIENVMEFMKGCELVPKEIWTKGGKKLPQTHPQDRHFKNDQLDWYYQKKIDSGEIGYCELDKDGLKKGDILPIWYANPNKIGEDYDAWVNHIKGMGYDYAWKKINAADLGEHTSRVRYFGLYAKPHLPIIFPEQSHSKTGEDGFKKWKPVKDVLDFSVLGEDILPEARIIAGKKPLVEPTMIRVFEGCVKWLAGGDRSFLKELSGDGFVATYHSHGHNTNPFTAPAPTVTVKEGLSAYFIDKAYSGKQNHSSIHVPCGAVMTKDHHSLIDAESFIMMPQWGTDCMTSTKRPCPTLIARMDKTAPYLIEMENGDYAIKINKHDSPAVKNIKMFMAAYSIKKIRMRMLLEKELLQIQGFPADYKLFGSSADRKKFIGNAVPTVVPQRWLEALAKPFVDTRIDDIVLNMLKVA